LREPTLTKHLLAWALGALVIVWGTFIVLGYRTGQHEADELTDGHLAGVAALLISYGVPGSGGQHPGRAPVLPPELKAHDYQQSMSVVVWDGAGRVLVRHGEAPVPEFDRSDGFVTLSLGQPQVSWRAFARWDGSGQRKVMVLLSGQERDDLARDIAGQIVEPGLWLLPVVALALGLAIRRGLKPLYQLSRDVDALDIERAVPLEARSRHRELRAAAMAINTLMERYQAALTRERDLADEFAHEMRTPLAAVSLHARALKGMPEGAERDQILAALERDVLRAAQVLSDLLALARASRAQWDEAAQEMDVAEVARGVLAEFAPAAHRRGQEIALVERGLLRLMGHPLLLELAVRNLVENALSHTCAGSRVEVQVDARQRSLQVCDTSPAPVHTPPRTSPADAHALGLGLGLGHRVVEKIAAIHRAEFSRVSQEGFGSCFRISFAPSSTVSR
jgi:two-component system, OmpR family, sensor histidine kinase QseC